MMRHAQLWLSGIAIAALIAGTSAQTGLVQNGSFETPVSDNAFGRAPATWFAGSTFDGHWYVSQGSIDIKRNPLTPNAYAGEQWVDLNGSPGIGGIYQDVTIPVAGLYTLSFAMNGNYGFNPEITRTMTVSLEGLFSGTFAHNYGDPWIVYSVNITVSTPGTYRLSFVSTTRGTYQDAYGPLVDDVRLELVPEPASLTAIGAGLASLLGLRRRKR